MRKTPKRRAKRAKRAEIDHAKVARLRKQLDAGQLGIDFARLIDGLAHAMNDEPKHPIQR